AQHNNIAAWPGKELVGWLNFRIEEKLLAKNSLKRREVIRMRTGLVIEKDRLLMLIPHWVLSPGPEIRVWKVEAEYFLGLPKCRPARHPYFLQFDDQVFKTQHRFVVGLACRCTDAQHRFDVRDEIRQSRNGFKILSEFRCN